MTAVTLPTSPLQRNATPRILDWGGYLEPPLGGPVQRIDRLGTRHAVDYVLPPIGTATLAMQWCQRLKRGLSLGVVMEFPQVGFSVGSPGSPTVSGSHSAAASAINLASLSGGYTEGQYFSVVHSGRRYLYSFDASGSSLSSVAISPMLRTALSNGDQVEMNPPYIEGRLVGDPVSWNIDDVRTYGIAFTIEEWE